MEVHTFISTGPVIAENGIRLCAGMISLYFHLSEHSLKLQMNLPSPAFPSLHFSADMWF